MIVPDTNLLVCATYRESPHHAKAWKWLETTLNGDEPVGLPWASVCGFLRISTNHRIMPSPWSIHDAMRTVDEWFARRNVVAIEAGERHWEIFRALIAEAGRGGNLTTDAHLAALCNERGATLHSADGDFSRFRGLRWENPIAHSSSAS